MIRNSMVFQILAVCWRTLASLSQNGLGFLIPLVIGLFGLAVLLYAIQLVSPVAPFVYSLF